jgi:hypothetical protein
VPDLVETFELVRDGRADQISRDLIERDTEGWPGRDDFKFSEDEYFGAVRL